eukprot:PhM_4_TR4795/c0_g1_i1/m.23173
MGCGLSTRHHKNHDDGIGPDGDVQFASLAPHDSSATNSDDGESGDPRNSGSKNNNHNNHNTHHNNSRNNNNNFNLNNSQQQQQPAVDPMDEDEDEDEEDDEGEVDLEPPTQLPSSAAERRKSNLIGYQPKELDPPSAMDFVFGDFDVNVEEANFQRNNKVKKPTGDDDGEEFVFGDFVVETELENQIVQNHYRNKLKGKQLKDFEDRFLAWGDFHLDSHEMSFFDEERNKLRANRPRNFIATYSMHNMIGHSNRVKSIIVCPNERAYISCSSTDHEACMWDSSTGQRLLGLSGHSSTITNITISPNSKLIATCGADCNVIVWDYVTGKKVSVFLHSKVPICATFSANCKSLITGAQDKLCRVWDMRKKKLQRQYNEHTGMVICVSAHPQQDTLASASSDKTVHIWNIITGMRLHVLEHNAIVLCCRFSNDGTRLLCNDEGTIRVWNTTNMTSVLQIHTRDIQATTRLTATMRRSTFMTSCFCPGEGTLGHFVIASCSDRSVRVFQGTTGKEVLMFYCKAPVYSMDAGHKEALAFGDSYGNVYIAGINI